MSGEEAVAICQWDHSVDLLLMDIDLGHGIDGTEAARMILATRRVPVVFLTSHTEKDYVERAKDISALALSLMKSYPCSRIVPW